MGELSAKAIKKLAKLNAKFDADKVSKRIITNNVKVILGNIVNIQP